MKNVILASTSSMFGEAYLDYLKSEVETLFQGVSELVFVPYARPGGISHDEYTQKVADFFEPRGIRVKGLHSFELPSDALKNAQAIFTGGGNTFLLVKQLHDQGLMTVLKAVVENGIPYLGTSAGSNIGGVNMQNTNDMPIVYPPSFDTMELVPFNLNAHYLDPNPNSKHNGERRETRIKEFHVFNQVPVVGLREGSWIRIKGDHITTEGLFSSRVFLSGQQPFEIEPGTLCSFE